ncbi:flagellar FlbD family protein [Leptospira sp. GIMC2001]|uniref:flagellar FlbD family protein n=1 Tax=Leptospira sp. GIMC2001 TaxID=1513297 RepID=UPI0004A5C527|nr:flagellar FlbD family protein [Leptospira sp. GIMC2001]AID56218.1 flagellar protein FlbD [Leptospira sp. GIMC2001]WCL49605.1 flagellar FlbD family protein [Leptospira sp. GIMC2001]
MIIVHRLKGEEFVINANLIETIEANPDTVVTLTTERKFVIKETVQELIQLVKDYHRDIYQSPIKTGRN